MLAPAAFCCEPARAAAVCKNHACSAHLSVYLDILLRNWSASGLTLKYRLQWCCLVDVRHQKNAGPGAGAGMPGMVSRRCRLASGAPAEEEKFVSEGYTGLMHLR